MGAKMQVLSVKMITDYLPAISRLSSTGSIRVESTDTCALCRQTAAEDLPGTPRHSLCSSFNTISSSFLQMFGSIGTQASLGLAAGCCLIGSALAELGPEEDSHVVQEKQVGASNLLVSVILTNH